MKHHACACIGTTGAAHWEVFLRYTPPFYSTWSQHRPSIHPGHDTTLLLSSVTAPPCYPPWSRHNPSIHLGHGSTGAAHWEVLLRYTPPFYSPWSRHQPSIHLGHYTALLFTLVTARQARRTGRCSCCAHRPFIHHGHDTALLVTLGTTPSLYSPWSRHRPSIHFGYGATGAAHWEVLLRARAIETQVPYKSP